MEESNCSQQLEIRQTPTQKKEKETECEREREGAKKRKEGKIGLEFNGLSQGTEIGDQYYRKGNRGDWKT